MLEIKILQDGTIEYLTSQDIVKGGSLVDTLGVYYERPRQTNDAVTLNIELPNNLVLKPRGMWYDGRKELNGEIYEYYYYTLSSMATIVARYEIGSNIKMSTQIQNGDTIIISLPIYWHINDTVNANDNAQLTDDQFLQLVETTQRLQEFVSSCDGFNVGTVTTERTTEEPSVTIVKRYDEALNRTFTDFTFLLRDGIGIESVTFVREETDGNVYNINLTNDTSYEFKALKGVKGDIGPEGPQGNTGDAGIGITSITLKEETETGNIYNVNLSDGTKYEIKTPASNYEIIKDIPRFSGPIEPNTTLVIYADNDNISYAHNLMVDYGVFNQIGITNNPDDKYDTLIFIPKTSNDYIKIYSIKRIDKTYIIVEDYKNGVSDFSILYTSELIDNELFTFIINGIDQPFTFDCKEGWQYNELLYYSNLKDLGYNQVLSDVDDNSYNYIIKNLFGIGVLVYNKLTKRNKIYNYQLSKDISDISNNKVLSTSNLKEEFDKKSNLGGTLLWSGSWDGSGSLTVDTLSKYAIIKVVMSDNTQIILSVSGATITGGSVIYGAETSQNGYIAWALRSGDVLSSGHFNKMYHAVNGNHGSLIELSIKQIIGVC